ncbi:hypothetical protein DDT56_18255 [Brenneria corticis]|uniref:Uncharacterized protein n=1 Tax=Brenneria corticis TaxID=2173106 RepID=A0A2U1TRZ4_9GAMM|nr:hypothetical protein DDT56_18255 [Brenneria sp. CFCC 11842]
MTLKVAGMTNRVQKTTSVSRYTENVLSVTVHGKGECPMLLNNLTEYNSNRLLRFFTKTFLRRAMREMHVTFLLFNAHFS